MEALLRWVLEWLQFIFQQLLQWLADTIGSLIDWVATLLQSLSQWLANAIKAVLDLITSWMTAVADFVGSLLETIGDTVLKLFQRFADATQGVLDKVANYISDVFASIQTLAGDVIDAVSGWIDSVANEITNLIDRGIDAISTIVTRVKEGIISGIDSLIEFVLQSVDTLVRKIEDAFDVSFEGIGRFLAQVAEKLGDIGAGFKEAALGAVEGLLEGDIKLWGGSLGSFEAGLKKIEATSTPTQIAEATQTLTRLGSDSFDPKQVKKFIEQEWGQFISDKGFLATVLHSVLAIVGILMFLLSAAQVNAQVNLQVYAKEFPFALMDAETSARAWRRGFIDKDTARDQLQRAGFSKDRADIMLNVTEIFPAPVDSFAMWHREIAKEAELDDVLKAQGFNEAWATRMKEASFIIPPVGDIITMAVREAFSPQIAERFGQFEDFPADFSKWAQAQGLTEEWAKRYWAAHWALPSPRQGFEMLHRGVIDESDLNLLMRALDVMPFWRDKLTAIAFSPFTRVDIRRMHKVGVLTEPEVNRAYKDIGYNEDKAKRLTDFTIALNAPASADDEVELTTLSRSSIVNFFGDGLLERQRAVTMLTDLGYSTDAANLFLSSAELDEERKERKAEITLTLDLAKARVITLEDAEVRLSRLGLETTEITKAISTLIREKQRRTKLPSRSEAEKMYRVGAITLDEYRELLAAFGYSEKWTEAFVTVLTTTKEE